MILRFDGGVPLNQITCAGKLLRFLSAHAVSRRIPVAFRMQIDLGFHFFIESRQQKQTQQPTSKLSSIDNLAVLPRCFPGSSSILLEVLTHSSGISPFGWVGRQQRRLEIGLEQPNFAIGIVIQKLLILG